MFHVHNKHLPALFCAALCGLVVARESKAQTIPGWGGVVDPTGDCRVVETSGVVAITVPGKYRDLEPTPEYNNVLAPRILREVAGDFQLQVKVQAFPRPEAKSSSSPQGYSYVAAGLLIWQDAKTFIRCQRAANGDRGDLFLHVAAFKDGRQLPVKMVAKTRILPDETTFMLVERRGNNFTFSVSSDGTAWAPIFSLGKFAMSGNAQVGVAVVNATNKEFTARFEDVKLTGK